MISEDHFQANGSLQLLLLMCSCKARMPVLWAEEWNSSSGDTDGLRPPTTCWNPGFNPDILSQTPNAAFESTFSWQL